MVKSLLAAMEEAKGLSEERLLSEQAKHKIITETLKLEAENLRRLYLAEQEHPNKCEICVERSQTRISKNICIFRIGKHLSIHFYAYACKAEVMRWSMHLKWCAVEYSILPPCLLFASCLSFCKCIAELSVIVVEISTAVV